MEGAAGGLGRVFRREGVALDAVQDVEGLGHLSEPGDGHRLGVEGVGVRGLAAQVNVDDAQCLFAAPAFDERRGQVHQHVAVAKMCTNPMPKPKNTAERTSPSM